MNNWEFNVGDKVMKDGVIGCVCEIDNGVYPVIVQFEDGSQEIFKFSDKELINLSKKDLSSESKLENINSNVKNTTLGSK
jgi:hypothetical protein